MEVICNYAQSSVAQEQDDGVNAKGDDGVKKIWASSTSGTHKIPILKEEEGREIYSNGILTSNTSNVTFRKYIIVTKLRPSWVDEF